MRSGSDMRVRFLSKNAHKIAEASTILKSVGVDLVPVHLPIDELQSDDVRAIVRNKTLRAFHLLGDLPRAFSSICD